MILQLKEDTTYVKDDLRDEWGKGLGVTTSDDNARLRSRVGYVYYLPLSRRSFSNLALRAITVSVIWIRSATSYMWVS